jgi:hypothetical protein
MERLTAIGLANVRTKSDVTFNVRDMVDYRAEAPGNYKGRCVQLSCATRIIVSCVYTAYRRRVTAVGESFEWVTRVKFGGECSEVEVAWQAVRRWLGSRPPRLPDGQHFVIRNFEGA